MEPVSSAQQPLTGHFGRVVSVPESPDCGLRRLDRSLTHAANGKDLPLTPVHSGFVLTDENIE